MNLFSDVKLAPDDPIMGVVEDFKNDPREGKANLSIGVYSDAEGKVPVLQAVSRAEQFIANNPIPKAYLPMVGFDQYVQEVQKMLFGEENPLLEEGRVATMQTVGGTGALKIGADFLKELYPDSKAYISDPTWDNHHAIFAGAGLDVGYYPYFDNETKGVNFDALYRFFSELPARSIVLMHVCCHNPTGADLSLEEWEKVAELIKERDLVPFLDMAYQGFSEGLEEDAKAIEVFIRHDLNFLISNSYSKSFSIYSERIGALSVVTNSKDEAERVMSRLKKMVRAIYSSPPSHGAYIVQQVLSSPELKQMWLDELAGMSSRIKEMRRKFVTLLNSKQDKVDFEFINRQAGMFSYSGLDKYQVEKMRKDYAIYTVDTGRICMAGLNEKNIELVANAVVNVL